MKFRMSGIFRDVYILKRPEQAISDYHIKTKIEDMIAKVELDMKFYFPVNVKISIVDLKVKERLTEHLKKDTKYRRVTIGVNA